jgi:hypothetical protein
MRVDFKKKVNLKIVDLDQSLYENNDEARTLRLIKDFEKNGIINNPILVGRVSDKQKFIILDGVNRHQALKRMGIKHVCAHVVDYYNEDDIELFSNCHFFLKENNDLVAKIKEILKNSWVRCSEDFAKKGVDSGEIVGYCRLGDQYYSFGECRDVFQTVKIMNSIVDLYLRKEEFCRLSEVVSRPKEAKIEIGFRRFKTVEISRFVHNNIIVNSGITRHVPSFNIIKINFPIAVLQSTSTLEEKNEYLRKRLKGVIEKQKFRYYDKSVFSCFD